MAIVTIAVLKTYFETGDFPTEAQFVDLIDTLSAGSILTGSASGLTATGANQATALSLNSLMNRIDTAAAGTGAKPSVTATVGFKQTIQNQGANDIVYYPFLGNNFLGLAVNAGYTIASGNQATVFCYSTGELTII